MIQYIIRNNKTHDRLYLNGSCVLALIREKNNAANKRDI